MMILYFILMFISAFFLVFAIINTYEKVDRRLVDYIVAFSLMQVNGCIGILLFQQNNQIILYIQLIDFIFLAISYFCVLILRKQIIVLKIKKELNNYYNNFTVKATFKKENIGENILDVGAIRHCCDYKLNISTINCEVNIYRVQELKKIPIPRRYRNMTPYYIIKYLTNEIVVEYKYALNTNINVNEVKEAFTGDYTTQIENDKNNIILKISHDLKNYNQGYIKNDIKNIKKYHDRLFGDNK